MIKLPQNDCTACSACKASCPRNAISFVLQANGFYYPYIDVTKCSNCGLCEKTCPALHPTREDQNQDVYLAWNKKLDIRLESSSGGIFSVIANSVLSQNGIVCGAMYDDKMNVIHGFAKDFEELKMLQGSKYVQSDIGNTFKVAKEYLKQGRLVYYTGTPCQIAGLKSFLFKDYKNLITSDLICHGVPSNALFQLQMKDLEKRLKQKIVDFKFRSKKRFGQGYDIQITSIDSSEKHIKSFYNAELIPYFYGFWKNITLRECCYECKYCTKDRRGDITLADYWTAKRDFSGIKMSKGLSLLLVNTDKGKQIIKQIKDEIGYKISLVENALKGQEHLKHPVKMPKKHDDFVKDFKNNMNFDFLSKKYLIPSKKETIKYQIRNVAKTALFYKYWK